MTLLNSIGIVLIASLLGSVTAAEWSGKIVFEDNFEGSSLDEGKWEYQESCGAEFGGGNLQCYTRRNVEVRNGNLIITAKMEKLEDKDYTSGRIRQRGPGFAYGAFVARARLARGDHLWPAIWTLHNQTKYTGNERQTCRYEEIDIMEYRGQPSQALKYDAAGHWGRAHNALTSSGKSLTTPFDLSQDFHEYAVLWRPSSMEWYLDKILYFNVSLTDGTFNKDPDKWPCEGFGKPIPFSEPTNFIINLAVGGSMFGSFPPLDPGTWTKTSMEVDWVRIYQG